MLGGFLSIQKATCLFAYFAWPIQYCISKVHNLVLGYKTLLTNKVVLIWSHFQFEYAQIFHSK